MVAYLGYTLRMRTLFRGWPIMVNDTHTRRRRLFVPYPWTEIWNLKSDLFVPDPWTVFSDVDCFSECKLIMLCLPCTGFSWGQPTWQGPGFSGLVDEETRPCASNFIQSVFETVQAECMNSVLVQTVPSVNDLIWEKIFPNIRIKSWFTNFLTMATKTLIITIKRE